MKCPNLMEIHFNNLQTLRPVQQYIFNDTVIKIELGSYDDRHTGFRRANAFLALLFLMSFCALPSLLITCQRYVKLSSHSRVSPVTVRDASKFDTHNFRFLLFFNFIYHFIFQVSIP